ncbi:MAG: glycosyltransferase family 4 protein [Bacteroidetes bacterium]|nr:glycosyltransferase family 4 protein [Bacteroidota bacterium]
MKPLVVWQLHEGNISGANIAMIEYVTALSDTYRFHAILPHSGTMCAALEKQNIPFSIIYQYGWAGKKGNLIQIFRKIIRTFIAIITVRMLLLKLKPSFVFTNTLIPFVSAKVSIGLKIPHVWFIHEFGWEDFGFRIGWGNESYAFKKMSDWSNFVIVNSDAVLKKIQTLLRNVEIKRIYQPVSWDSHDNFNRTKIACFLMFGQLAPTKGHIDVLEALAIAHKKSPAKKVSLHIVGPSEDKQYVNFLYNVIEQLQLQEIVKIKEGYFDKEQIIPRYEALIVASNSEAFGRVIIEAKKAGLGIIARNTGGAPELLSKPQDHLFESIEELGGILSCYNHLSHNDSFLPYDEGEEILKLKNLLQSII